MHAEKLLLSLKHHPSVTDDELMVCQSAKAIPVKFSAVGEIGHVNSMSPGMSTYLKSTALKRKALWRL